MFVSTDGRTFAEPPADWQPSDPNGGGPGFGGRFQSLAGDLIRDGDRRASPRTSPSPFWTPTMRPQILFPAYLAGFNLVESFYLAMPYLSWETVVIGDPLCTPFPRRPVPAAALDAGIDAATELPAIFAERRLSRLRRGGVNADAVKLLLKADVHSARGETADIQALLERATEIEPRLSLAHLRLAAIYEQHGEYDKAIERYRRVIAVDPLTVEALNNLAYALAEHKQQPKEALVYAERAYRIAPGALVADTLAWVQHLLGDDRSAAPLLERATAASPETAEIWLHAAFVHAALNSATRASSELATAMKLDATYADRADVKALIERLKRPEPPSEGSAHNTELPTSDR